MEIETDSEYKEDSVTRSQAQSVTSDAATVLIKERTGHGLLTIYYRFVKAKYFICRTKYRFLRFMLLLQDTGGTARNVVFTLAKVEHSKNMCEAVCQFM